MQKKKGFFINFWHSVICWIRTLDLSFWNWRRFSSALMLYQRLMTSPQYLSLKLCHISSMIYSITSVAKWFKNGSKMASDSGLQQIPNSKFNSKCRLLAIVFTHIYTYKSRLQYFTCTMCSESKNLITYLNSAHQIYFKSSELI